MHGSTLILYTDQPERRGDLVRVLEQISPCRMLDASVEAPAVDCVALVADLDLLKPSAFLGLRTLIAGSPGLPRVFLMRSMGERSLSAARGLGARLCLPTDTPPATVADALRAQFPTVPPPPPSAGSAVIAKAADRAGAVIAGLMDAARVSGTVDSASIDEGLTPILGAITAGGLEAWLAAVRAYDDATYQHCLLVAGLAATFAISLGFSESDRQQLVRAALVHDVGKAKIPLAILNKPGPLDPAERSVMSTHAALGHAILVQAGGFDDTVLSVVRHHHEMLDGSGYPDRLAGREIGDLVRLITVCDIYAALVERRPYRAPMPTAKALQVLYGMTGKLDMDLVRAFERAVTKT